MEMEHGKLFIGGISWETNEEGLKDYFKTFGEVMEAVIMKDRTTGRARGFGFVVFTDPVVAERVVKEKHIIDGRTVEAKKAVPRDDERTANRSNGVGGGSLQRTKKIFVGGLASSVTESDLKKYFEQFGTISDVVVMYDHNTHRPRGFGFITYDSEESVDKALLKTFHQLNGKMVEVKRAVPKESSRGQISGLNYGLSRVANFMNGHNTQGFNSPTYGRFSPSSFNLGLNSDSILGIKYGNIGSNLGYTRTVSPMYSASSNRYGDPIGYVGNGGNGNVSSFLNSNHSMWGNGNQSFTANSSNFLAPRNASGRIGATWGDGGNGGFSSGNLGYEESNIGCRRNNGNSIYSYGVIDDGEIGGNSYGDGGSGGGSFYADSKWRSSSPELEVDDLFGYSLGSGTFDDMPKKHTCQCWLQCHKWIK